MQVIAECVNMSVVNWKDVSQVEKLTVLTTDKLRLNFEINVVFLNIYAS